MTNDPTPAGGVPVIAEGSATGPIFGPGRWMERLAGLASERLTRDIFHTVVTSFLLFGLLTVQGVLLARILGPEKRGIYATVVFYTQTLTFIGLFGTQHAVARWAARRKRDTAVLMSVCGRLGVVTGLVTMVVVAGLSLWVLPAEKQYLAPLCIVCSLFLPLEHVRQLWLSVDHGLGRFKSYNANRLVAGVAFPVLLALAWLSGFHTVGVMIACFVVAPILGLLYRRATDPRREIETTAGRGPTVGRILERGRPYAAAVLAADLFERIDVFLFIWLASFTAQGYYAAAVPSANLLLVVPIAISLFAFNAGADRNKALTPKRLLWTSGAVLLVQILSAVAYAAVLKPLVLLVFGASFGGAVPLTLALLPAYALAGCGRVAESYLQGRNRALLGVYSRLAGSVVMLGFVFLFFGRWAEVSIPLGVVAGTVVSTTILAVAVAVDVLGSNNAGRNGGGVR